MSDVVDVGLQRRENVFSSETNNFVLVAFTWLVNDNFI